MVDRGKVVTRPRSEISREPVNQCVSDIDETEDIRPFFIDIEDDDEDTPAQTSRSGSPAMVVTPPGVSTFTMFSERSRQSSETTIRSVAQGPRLRPKANTAPPGAFKMYHEAHPQFKLQPPRRVISSTTAHAFPRPGSRDQRGPSKAHFLTTTELSHSRRIMSKSPIGKKKTKRNLEGMIGLKPKPLVWRMSSPPKAFELPPELKQSFSEKARVKETLKQKKMETLKVDFLVSKPRGLPSTPAPSIVPTPNVFYQRPASVRTKTLPTPARGSTPLRATSSGSDTPLGNSTPPKASSPLRTATPQRSTTASETPPWRAEHSRSGTISKGAKHFSLPLSPVAQRVPWRRSIVVDSAQRHATPNVTERRTVYIPGPIQLEEIISGTHHRGSIAIFEQFDDDIAPKAQRFSDLVALDGIVMYFEGLGVAEEASEVCLDRYWLRNRRNSRPSSGTSAKSARKGAPAMPSVPPPPVPSPLSGIATTFEGIFRSQKALRDDAKAPPSSGTAGRRKPLLRQLLKSSRKSG